MSRTADAARGIPAPTESPPSRPEPTLAELRADLDRLDDGLHDLLMRRADVVARIAALGAKGKVPIRPGREAQIVRRLLARHHGGLPPRALPRIWRELFAATTSMQGPYAVSVCDASGDGSLTPCAREHFGALTPLRVAHTPAQAIRDVRSGAATVAVLSLPREEEPVAEAWWLGLMVHDEPRVHVVARLPFWAPRPEGAPRAEALVVAAVAPDPSLDDRALIGFELPPDVMRTGLDKVLTAAGLSASAVLLRRDARQPAHALIDIEGFMADDDRRLAELHRMLASGPGMRRPVVLGCYAVPLAGECA